MTEQYTGHVQEKKRRLACMVQRWLRLLRKTTLMAFSRCISIKYYLDAK